MAKSQYTDSIDYSKVVLDIRSDGDRFINFKYKDHPIKMNYYTANNVSISSNYKFSTNSLKLTKFDTIDSSISFNICNYSISNFFTLSWWMKTYSSITSATPSGYNLKVPYILISQKEYLTDTSVKQFRSIEPYYCNSNSSAHACIQSGVNGTSWDWNTNTITNITPILNSWVHYAIIVNGVNTYLYRNGTLLLSNNKAAAQYSTSYKIAYIVFSISYNISTNAYIELDDIVLIDGQNLWTSNFTAPNYFLTGDRDLEDPKRFSNKCIIYPRPTDLNDYFDKAFIY